MSPHIEIHLLKTGHIIHHQLMGFVVQWNHGQRDKGREKEDMEQLMEPEVGGPRHAKPVTLVGRAKHALDKGPGRWSWKTNTLAIMWVVFVIVGLGVGAFVAVAQWANSVAHL